MKILRKVFTLTGARFCAMAMIAAPLSAQTGTVTGSVQEVGTGLPLAGAQVSIARRGLWATSPMPTAVLSCWAFRPATTFWRSATSVTGPRPGTSPWSPMRP